MGERCDSPKSSNVDGTEELTQDLMKLSGTDVGHRWSHSSTSAHHKPLSAGMALALALDSSETVQNLLISYGQIPFFVAMFLV